MAEFPRIHWKSIDGENVPFTEPQHFTGEGDEVVRTGDNNPLPTKDDGVFDELQTIKEENEELRQTQQRILERLDDPVDTRLTGSNVEYESDYPDANAGEKLEAIEQTQESIIGALQTTNESLNSVIKDDKLQTNLKTNESSKDNAIYTSSVEEYKLETILDGEVLETNEQKIFHLDATNEKGIYLFISVDKPNWTLRGRTLFGRLNHETTFPSYDNHDNTYSSSEPAIAFLLGIRPNAQGLENPKNLDEARALRMPISSDEYALIKNFNEEPSTFTVKVLRVW